MDTKRLRQRLLDLAIHGRLVEQDPEEEAAEVLLRRIREEKKRLAKDGRGRGAKMTDEAAEDAVCGPFELPKGWVWTTLGTVGTWQAGGTPNRANKEFYVGNIPWLKTGDLNDGIITFIPETISEKAVLNSSAKLNPTGSVLIAMYGATIGKLGLLSFPATTNQACCACIEYFGIDSQYLFYYLLSHRQQFVAKGGGGAQPNISKEIIVNTRIPLPPLSEQRRIASRLDQLFSAIDAIDRGRASLLSAIKQTRSRLLDLAIHGRLVEQDPEEEAEEVLLRRIKPDFKVGEGGGDWPLPKGWQEAPMSDLCVLHNGQKEYGTARLNLDVKYLRGESDGKRISSGQVVQKGDLLILVDGENSGEVFRVPTEGYKGSTFKQLVINKNMFSDYLLYVITLHRKALRESKVGSAIPHLNKKLFGSIRVPVPPYNEQRRIAARLEQLFCTLDRIEAALQA